MLVRLLPPALLLAGALPAMAQTSGTDAPATKDTTPSATASGTTGPAETEAVSGPPADAPLAGWTDGTLFLRSPDNLFQLFPNGRLQVDGYAYGRPTDAMPYPTFLVKRARLEMFGWIGPWFGFNIAGDFAAGPTPGANPVAPSAQNTTDDFVLIAPWKNVAILQVGQYDAPFTLENRTSDKYFDFIERSNTVRAFGIPTNKEIGAMVHGLLPSKLVYYSVGVFNGDGQNFRNTDDSFDVMGRAWVAPFALRHGPLDEITVGGSFWVGNRGEHGLPLAAQTTAGGFRYFGDKWTSDSTPLELHQSGALRAYAIELDAPIAHRFGARIEVVHKRQELAESDVSQSSSGKLRTLGRGTLEGWSGYAQAWVWVFGDDTIVGRPGLQLPPRLTKFGASAPRQGLQLLARVERLDETLETDTPALGNPNAGNTTLTSVQLGATYWYSKRFRTMLNYDINHFGGDSAVITSAVGDRLAGGRTEHELLMRLAIAL